jgi:hypothetical protein
MNKTINRIFDTLSKADISPTSNYSVPEYWMRRAMKGDEKCKRNLFNWISNMFGVDEHTLNSIFNEKYGINENRKKKLIKLTESDLQRIVNRSVKQALKEAKVEDWDDDDFITWDDYAYYCNHSADWVDKNSEKSDRLGIPDDERCYFCQKPVKKYKTLYAKPGEYPYYGKPGQGRTDTFKVGPTCAKAVEKAHNDKYGK